ncbi:MAG: hypothetical protein JSU94_14060 [Phycisphaerales bacterium]|nr:MAG: hypothetical protein JSU94_14060 [Phycisphaerales bacterium]
MIEKALRERLEPVVSRRRRLYLARRLSVYWSVLGLVGVFLLAADWYWGWRSPAAVAALCITAVLATLLALRACRRMQPDYKAVARNIEQKHPDLKALLLAAIEQEPRGADGRLGYLQEKVIGEALSHAKGHDWLRSVPTGRLVLANVVRAAALLFLAVVLSRVLVSTLPSRRTGGAGPARKGYHVTVTPGDTTVERGAPVVILARFEGRVPAEATLVTSESGKGQVRVPLTKNLEDPVFGGIIQQVGSDMLYRIEYAGASTRDYKIRTYEHPSLRTADAHIVYPSYTNLPDKTVKDTRHVSVIEGSQVTVKFTLNKPVASARLEAAEQPALDLSADGEYPNVYTASMTATQSRRYELHLTDAEGHANKMPSRFTIDVHKNVPADLRPLFPNRDIVASALEELSLEAEASDDFGLAAFGLGYTLAGGQSSEVTLGPGEASKEKQQIRYLLALEELGARPDQLLTYYFWADDFGPDGGRRRTYSDMYFAEVRHFEEIFRESESFQDQAERSQREREREQQDGQQQDRQGEQLARLQKQIINATWNIKQQAERSGGVQDHKEDIDVVRQSQADAAEKAKSALAGAEDPPAIRALQDATKHMETSLEHLTKAAESLSADQLTPALGAEQSAYQELLKLREREHQIAQARSSDRSSRASSARSQQQLQQLELTQRENRYETERMAQNRQQQTQREDLEVLNRLADLARRQNQMSEKLREAQAALRQAQNEQQRQEALRELKRLRDQQLEALRDVDDLQERMERPQNRSRMADAREQLGDSRSRIRQSAEELERGMLSGAITSATRAQRQLEQMRDEFRRNTSGQLGEQMRDMRQQARELAERQEQIAEEINNQVDAREKRLADSGINRELADRTERQRESMRELIDQMKDVSEQAETSEPLLSQRLYDTLRRTSTENVDRALEVTGELLRRNFLPQARDVERRAGEGVDRLREGVEEAAESVLGDEAEALRMARGELDELIRQVDEEAAGRGQGRAGDPNEPADGDPNQARVADARSAQRGQQQGRQQGQASAGDPERGDRPADEPRGGQGGPQGDRQQARGDRTGADIEGRNDPTGWGGGRRSNGQWEDAGIRGPLTGEDFRPWAERLRDVEEMLTERDLRSEAARVLERAQAMRAEFKRHGKEPQWDLVEERIIKPLTELRKNLSNKLARLESDQAVAPIDRDPVPGRFSELVRKYFENLGSGE